jgi:hypothetical protein
MRLNDSNIFWVFLQKIKIEMKKAEKANDALEDAVLSTMITLTRIALVITASGLVGPISPEETNKIVSWFAQGIIFSNFGMVCANCLKYDRAVRSIEVLLK